MGLYWRATALVLMALLLGLSLGKEQSFGMLLTLAACVLAATAAMEYLEPVVSFLRELESLGSLRGDFLGILLKAAGIGLVSQIAGSVCADGGNSALAGEVRLLGSAAVLYVSLPLFTGLLNLIQEILGEL